MKEFYLSGAGAVRRDQGGNMNQMETRLDKRRYTVSDEGYKV